MTPTDWRDALGALLPDGYVPEPEEAPVPEERPKPRLRVTLDRRRKGKIATIVTGFEPDDDRAADLAADMRRALATGGSVADGEILVQGNRVDDVKKFLISKGYKC